MPNISSRRTFLTVAGGAAAASLVPGWRANARSAAIMNSKFKLSVITDEISQDFGHALEVASKEFGFGYVEVRTLWDKNFVALSPQETAEAKRLLDKFNLRVTDVASPLFKTDWPGAPKSKYSPAKPEFGADFPFQKQDELLERSIEMAKALGTDRVRCFDFWRLEDPKPYLPAIYEKLQSASAKAAQKNISLLLENEFACNTATAAESAETLKHVTAPNFFLNWDPGNAAYRGEQAYPEGYAKLPKHRIHHMHCKDVVKKSDGTYEWAAMGHGLIDYISQFRNLLKDGYTGTMSLETHWRGAGTPEESTRQSWAGMKTQLQKAGAL
ncbi:MAG TPA: TIM barrel protein [Candidatus Saccharimonadales bacterium]|nr:TIM barrel protein [Candidatus Saccharimonadales bacterium]